MRPPLHVAFALVVVLSSRPAAAEPAPPTTSASSRAGADAKPGARSADDEPLGLALEGWAYPHPVKLLPLEIEGQRVNMAYMDVRPARPERGVVVLFHGKNFFGAYWEQTIAALRDAGYRVVVPDQIGFGKSTKADVRYSFHQLAANTKRLLEHLGIERAAVVGHSMGGMLATRFALLFPSATTALVLENPIGLEDYRAEVPWVPLEEIHRAELALTPDAVRGYHRTYYPRWRPAYGRFADVQARWTKSPEYPRLAWVSALTTQMIYEQPVVHEFPNVRARALVVIGQEDRTVVGKNRLSDEQKRRLGHYPTLGRKTAAAIPGAKLVEYDGVGHVPHLEIPERFAADLIAFLDAG